MANILLVTLGNTSHLCNLKEIVRAATHYITAHITYSHRVIRKKIIMIARFLLNIKY